MWPHAPHTPCLLQAGVDKEKRTAMHKAVRRHFPHLTSTTVAVGEGGGGGGGGGGGVEEGVGGRVIRVWANQGAFLPPSLPSFLPSSLHISLPPPFLPLHCSPSLPPSFHPSLPFLPHSHARHKGYQVAKREGKISQVCSSQGKPKCGGGDQLHL